VEEAIRISVQRNPAVLAEALFPVLGSAIRKAINTQLQAMMDALNQSIEAGLSLRGIQWRLESMRTGRPFG
jgi:OOP family OmpA-OmpF porin